MKGARRGARVILHLDYAAKINCNMDNYMI